MPDSNTATPLPAPEAGSTTQPDLSVVPETAPRRAPTSLNRAQQGELTKASEICIAAQKPEYAPALATRGIDAAFVTALVNLIVAASQQGQRAVDCDGACKDARQAEATAAKTLLESLQALQAAARSQHLPENAGRLESYYVGQKLDQSRPLLEGYSQNILNKANEERPSGIDTAVIQRVQGERAAYVAASTARSTESGKSKQGRAQRDALVKEIIAQRKKIQYAADSLWPPGKPESAQARAAFKLPANRPYSY
jgi:hypothetical protein